jgi:sugar lactone lactonase YvrE
MGSASLGSSPVGTAGAPATVFFNFNQTVTPASILFSQPGTGSDFVASATNPIADPSATSPELPCTAGKQYNAFTTCPYFVTLNPRLPGPISGQVALLDSNNKVIGASKTYLSGVGQAPAISLLIPASQTAIASGLVSPQQTATDSLGNAYVADSGLGKVLQFAAGASAPTAGVSIGTGLSAPTGVAVDGSGDVYIADSGKVYEVPFVNGALSASGQTTLKSGLGSNLKLATDGSGNVFVADPDHARVIKIPNPLTSSVDAGLVTIGSGFTKPSAITTDSQGNVFVADGSTLSEIVATFAGPPVAITNSLLSPVTGLAVDPSGSVIVAQSGGLIRIPSVSGTLSANSAVSIDGTALTAPNSVAIDTYGNLYVSDLTGGTPNLQLLSLNASVDFGQVGPFAPSNPVDVDVFNIGNLPLTIMPDPTFTGTDAADFSVTQATQNGCDTTGATPVIPGTSCIIDVVLTAGAAGTRTGTMSVTSNAANASAVTASLTGFAVSDLERSKVVVAINPSTGVTYPGATSITVTVSPTVSTTTPTGHVTLTLINQNAALRQATTYPLGTLADGVTTFNIRATRTSAAVWLRRRSPWPRRLRRSRSRSQATLRRSSTFTTCLSVRTPPCRQR